MLTHEHVGFGVAGRGDGVNMATAPAPPLGFLYNHGKVTAPPTSSAGGMMVPAPVLPLSWGS